MTETAPTTLVVENYGCVKHAELKLTPLHALIGPNDSGKSTLLRALRTVLDFGCDGLQGPWDPGTRPWSIELSRDPVRVRIDWSKGRLSIAPATQMDLVSGGRSMFLALMDQFPHHGARESLLASFARGARLVRLDHRALRAPSPLVPTNAPIRFDEAGTGLAGVLDAIQTRNLDAFLELRADVRRLFPAVRNIALENESAANKIVVADLVDGTRVKPEFLSDGLLYYVAFKALAYLEPVSAILIEEPQNGLHPSRIGDVMRVLREVSKTQQVLLATHSPLVINELQPDEVTVVTRSADEGTRITPLAATPNFEERAKIYSLGELWLSYANGEDEAPLLNGPAP